MYNRNNNNQSYLTLPPPSHSLPRFGHNIELMVAAQENCHNAHFLLLFRIITSGHWWGQFGLDLWILSPAP